MMEGKVRAALRQIGDNNTGQPLHLNSQIAFQTHLERVQDILLKQHPPKQPHREESLDFEPKHSNLRTPSHHL